MLLRTASFKVTNTLKREFDKACELSKFYCLTEFCLCGVVWERVCGMCT